MSVRVHAFPGASHQSVTAGEAAPWLARWWQIRRSNISVIYRLSEKPHVDASMS